MKPLVYVVLSAAVAAALPGLAQTGSHEGHHAQAAPASAGSKRYTEGEVKKIDKDAGKITLKHGAIENLGMPPMTMVFRTKDPSALDKVNVGDSVRFKAEQIEGAMTVTELQPLS